VAVDGLRETLTGVQLRGPEFPVVSNVTAGPVHEAARARELLVEQLTSPVRWTASMQAMVGEGLDAYLELGPGNVLAGLMKRVSRDLSVRSLGTAQDVETYLGEG
jgi:[acyl-carrier-protein] S-malonyltransferase